MDEKQDNTTPATDTSTSVMEVAKNEALSNVSLKFGRLFLSPFS